MKALLNILKGACAVMLLLSLVFGVPCAVGWIFFNLTPFLNWGATSIALSQLWGIGCLVSGGLYALYLIGSIIKPISMHKLFLKLARMTER